MLDRLHGLKLAAIITVALVVKVAIAYLLYEALFAPPPVKKTPLPPAKVEQRMPGTRLQLLVFIAKLHSKTAQPGSDTVLNCKPFL